MPLRTRPASPDPRRRWRTSVRWAHGRGYALDPVADTITDPDGAREHNLRNVDLELPRDQLIVFTGLSGSGKSSLAFDTIYAEGQRRYVESLSALRPPVPRPDGQARRRLHRGPVAGDLDRPEVGVAQPALDRRHDHRDLRLPAPALRAHRRAALPELRAGHHPPDAAADRRPRARSCPRARGSRCWRRSCGAARASTRGCSKELAQQGFTRARVDGELRRARRGRAERAPGPVREPHHRGRRRPARAPRRASSGASPTRSRPRCAWPRASPRSRSCRATASDAGEPETLTFSEHLACTHCGLSFDELAPRNFSFNSPYGACERCDGLGTRFEVDPELVVPDDDLSHRATARSRRGPGSAASTSSACSTRSADEYGFSHRHAVEEAEEEGEEGGALRHRRDRRCRCRTATATAASARTRPSSRASCPWLERRHTEAESDRAREQIEGYMREVPCPACGGARLRPASLAVTIGGQNIYEVGELSIRKAAEFLGRARAVRARPHDRRAGA